MQLAQFTDLGLRIVMGLAVLPAGETRRTQDVAAQIDVSPTHAAKVVARLASLGVVETRRGRTGGLSLTDAGRETSVGWLARQLEGVGEVVDCEGGVPCPLRDACRLRGLLAQAREAFFTTLDGHTMAEIAGHPTGTVLLTLAAR
ncbi:MULTISPECIES: RrF2 family transcriptional regulator [Mumia]|uniref:RrF2 family transcriptional regulator n=1 Tax=Mumia TaxID=1546255 RepID=UPI00142206A2|nr:MULTISPECIES: Rrf2 family transcriptional regulator [unclassified Mumia]QMW66163.1 Rrf2 family transcriptional regulator [Mumia sp. ZJ1417]